MLNIRVAAFETNSSSTHSISGVAGDRNATLPLCKTSAGDDVIVIATKDFGWEWVRYTAASSKAAYILTYLYQQDPDRIPEFLKIVADWTGFTVIPYCASDNYIDHESIGVAQSIATGTKQQIIDFIFCPSIELRTGNDNDDMPHDFLTAAFYLRD